MPRTGPVSRATEVLKLIETKQTKSYHCCFVSVFNGHVVPATGDKAAYIRDSFGFVVLTPKAIRSLILKRIKGTKENALHGHLVNHIGLKNVVVE